MPSWLTLSCSSKCHSYMLLSTFSAAPEVCLASSPGWPSQPALTSPLALSQRTLTATSIRTVSEKHLTSETLLRSHLSSEMKSRHVGGTITNVCANTKFECWGQLCKSNQILLIGIWELENLGRLQDLFKFLQLFIQSRFIPEHQSGQGKWSKSMPPTRTQLPSKLT